ncbi:MAG: lipocalin family protein [Hyphomonadaceae bacterium]|nr:lipocalin family protein [Hyphomonadaceae bacterium]
MTRAFKPALGLAALAMITACSSGISGRPADAPPPVPVASVDLSRYAGTWYEIARYPNSFQKNCEGTTAEYGLRPDGRINVTNTCRVTNRPNSPRSARAVASVIDGSNGARIAVNFAPIPLPKGEGNYWVLYLDPDYRTALVGSPSGEFLWMLSRTPFITPDQRAALNAAATANGYRLDLLKETDQFDPTATTP